MKKEDREENFLNRKTSFKIYELLLFSLLIIIGTFFITVLTINIINDNKDVKPSSSKIELSEVNEVYNLLKESYYKDVDDSVLAEGAIKGMLESLNDPHTVFYSKEESEAFDEMMSGTYEGVGIEITKLSNDNIIVTRVFKGSSAYEKGMKMNDVIVSVDEKSTKGLSTTDVVALIKKNGRKDVTIKVLREGKEIKFELTKGTVTIDSVESKIMESNNKKIGYIIINNFADNTFEQFKKQLEDLEGQTISGLIIDVRYNSGGYLRSVTNILDIILPEGKVMYQIADKETTTKYPSQSFASRNYPIVVLTNEGSASASEILAIGLKESYGAEIVGTKTYGKGTVQTTRNLESGAMLKYTIQKWLSPEGNWIDGKGVEPTIKVELSDKYKNDPIEANDNQLQKALDVVSKK